MQQIVGWLQRHEPVGADPARLVTLLGSDAAVNAAWWRGAGRCGERIRKRASCVANVDVTVQLQLL